MGVFSSSQSTMPSGPRGSPSYIEHTGGLCLEVSVSSSASRARTTLARGKDEPTQRASPAAGPLRKPPGAGASSGMSCEASATTSLQSSRIRSPNLGPTSRSLVELSERTTAGLNATVLLSECQTDRTSGHPDVVPHMQIEQGPQPRRQVLLTLPVASKETGDMVVIKQFPLPQC